MDESVPDLSRLKIDRSVPTPRRGGLLPWVILALVLGIGGWFGWSRGWFTASGSGPAVEIARVQRIGGAAAQSGVAASGYVVARRQAALSTDIQGRLVELPVEEGTRVKEGLSSRASTPLNTRRPSRAGRSAGFGASLLGNGQNRDTRGRSVDRKEQRVRALRRRDHAQERRDR